MPLGRYFAWVGAFLLGALFVADWCLPAPVHAPRSEVPPYERTNLRIRSDHRWPERIVFDTTATRVAPVADAAAAPDAAPHQDLVQVEQRDLRTAFAAADSAQIAGIATKDKATAIGAKPRVAGFRMTRMTKAD